LVTKDIEAVAFDCYGTLVDFGDGAFAQAYGLICAEQGLAIDGQAFYDKWMEVWRRLAHLGQSADPAIAIAVSSLKNEPGPLSETEPVPPHPQHHTPSAGRNRALDGPLPPYRPYREEWPEHFAICFEELGVQGDAQAAHERLVEMLGQAQAFPEARRVVETVSRRLPVAAMSNADDDFLYPCLARNGLVFPVVISSETAKAYKPHVTIFKALSESIGLTPDKTLYVGDSRLADVAGAKNAGMRVAWVNRFKSSQGGSTRMGAEDGTSTRPPVEPDYEIESLDGLLDVLELR
jgi:2-haloalkanoic acid dehalogenase type II